MWSLECKHQMLTDDARRTTDDARRTTTDDGQPLTTIAHLSTKTKTKYEHSFVEHIIVTRMLICKLLNIFTK